MVSVVRGSKPLLPPWSRPAPVTPDTDHDTPVDTVPGFRVFSPGLGEATVEFDCQGSCSDLDFKALFFTVQTAPPYLNDAASVIITGNAGDGKTAFIKRIEQYVGKCDRIDKSPTPFTEPRLVPHVDANVFDSRE